jgi:hypothetical protein
MLLFTKPLGHSLTHLSFDTYYYITTVTFSLLCDTPSRYCIEYNNGTLHDVLTFELIVVISAIIAIAGYLRASVLFQAEQQQPIETSSTSSDRLLGDETTATN